MDITRSFQLSDRSAIELRGRVELKLVDWNDYGLPPHHLDHGKHLGYAPRVGKSQDAAGQLGLIRRRRPHLSGSGQEYVFNPESHPVALSRHEPPLASPDLGLIAELRLDLLPARPPTRMHVRKYAGPVVSEVAREVPGNSHGTFRRGRTGAEQAESRNWARRQAFALRWS